jgi:hypothetical protein
MASVTTTKMRRIVWTKSRSVEHDGGPVERVKEIK